MVSGYCQTAAVIFRLTGNDPEQGRFSRSVISYKPYSALGGYKPVYSVKDGLFFEIYMQIFYLYQFVLPPE